MPDTVNLGPAEPKRETDKALLVVLEIDGEERWIPKSVIDDDSECFSTKGGAGDLIVEAWWAQRQKDELPDDVFREDW